MRGRRRSRRQADGYGSPDRRRHALWPGRSHPHDRPARHADARQGAGSLESTSCSLDEPRSASPSPRSSSAARRVTRDSTAGVKARQRRVRHGERHQVRLVRIEGALRRPRSATSSTTVAAELDAGRCRSPAPGDLGQHPRAAPGTPVSTRRIRGLGNAPHRRAGRARDGRRGATRSGRQWSPSASRPGFMDLAWRLLTSTTPIGSADSPAGWTAPPCSAEHPGRRATTPPRPRCRMSDSVGPLNRAVKGHSGGIGH